MTTTFVWPTTTQLNTGPIPDADDERMRQSILAALPEIWTEAVLFDVSDVRQHLLTLKPPPSLDELPYLVAPYTHSVWEFDVAPYTHNSGELEPGHRACMLLTQIDLHELPLTERLARKFGTSPDELADARWQQIYTLFLRSPESPDPYLWSNGMLLLNEQGGITIGPSQLWYHGHTNLFHIPDTPPPSYGACFGMYVSTVWYALSMLSCKNIQAVPRQAEETRQQRRARERRGTPRFIWHTLEVSGKSPDKSQATGTGPKGKALHLCRGHFAEYTTDAPLFGKHVGRFWVPAHVRGSLRYGAVGKDYRIVKP